MTYANAFAAHFKPHEIEQMSLTLTGTPAPPKPKKRAIQIAVEDPQQYSIMLAQRKREKERHELLALIGWNEMKLRMGAEAFLAAIARPPRTS